MTRRQPSSRRAVPVPAAVHTAPIGLTPGSDRRAVQNAILAIA